MNIQTSVRPDKAELARLAREEAYSTPLKDFHPGAPRLFQDDTLWPWFERLRKEEPVHYCANSRIEMPPRETSEEKMPWLVSTCMMSLYLVTDQ